MKRVALGESFETILRKGIDQTVKEEPSGVIVTTRQLNVLMNELGASALNGMAIAKLYGWPMSKPPKKGSQEHELCKLIGCLFRHFETPYKKGCQEKYRALVFGKSTAKDVAQRKARTKMIEESKVAAKIWEPEEDPDRKNDGLDTQVGHFALRGQLEIPESECTRGGTHEGGRPGGGTPEVWVPTIENARLDIQQVEDRIGELVNENARLDRKLALMLRDEERERAEYDALEELKKVNETIRMVEAETARLNSENARVAEEKLAEDRLRAEECERVECETLKRKTEKPRN